MAPWPDSVRSFIRSTCELRPVAESVNDRSRRIGLATSGVRVSPEEGLVAASPCGDPILGENRRICESRDLVPISGRVGLWLGMGLVTLDESDDSVPEPIRLPMPLVTSELILSLRADDRV